MTTQVPRGYIDLSIITKAVCGSPNLDLSHQGWVALRKWAVGCHWAMMAMSERSGGPPDI